MIYKTNKKYFRTFIGWSNKVYSKQKQSSKKRGHPPPEYSKEELREWVLKQHNFKELFNNWKESGFLKELVPSIDRLKSSLPYKFNNIKLTTWMKNKSRQELSVRLGLEKGKCKIVLQICKNTGKVLNEFKSSMDAQRKLGFHSGHIRSCCNGKLKTHKGFIWKHK